MGSITTYPVAPSQAPNSPVTLAYAQITADTATVTASADVPGLSVTVTVPEGRRLRVSVHGLMWGDTDSAGARLAINEGAVMLQLVDTGMTGAKQEGLDASVILTPSAGTHTYKAVYSRWTGTGNVKVLANASYPAYILVEDITGMPTVVPPASVPVGRIGYSERLDGAPVAIGSGAQDLGPSVNVVVPAGRTLRITGFACLANGSAGATEVRVMEDAVTSLNRSYFGNLSAGQIVTHSFSWTHSPSAGAHTYKLQSNNGAAGTLYADGVNECSLLVEDITPTPAPANTAPSSTLAYAEATGNQGSITSTQTDITGLSVTVTVPAGRRIRISARTYWTSTTSDGDALTGIFEGATQLQESRGYVGGTTAPFAAEPSVVLSPSAGTHTYKVVGKRVTGTGTLTNNVFSGGTSFILVEDITGSGISGHTHTELDDSGWVPINSFANGWNYYGGSYTANVFSSAAWRKKAGIVYLRGLIYNGTITSGTIMFTLPVGFRPTAGLSRLFNTTSNDAICRIDVQGDGAVKTGPGVNAVWVSLDGIIFVADA